MMTAKNTLKSQRPSRADTTTLKLNSDLLDKISVRDLTNSYAPDDKSVIILDLGRIRNVFPEGVNEITELAHRLNEEGKSIIIYAPQSIVSHLAQSALALSVKAIIPYIPDADKEQSTLEESLFSSYAKQLAITIQSLTGSLPKAEVGKIVAQDDSYLGAIDVLTLENFNVQIEVWYSPGAFNKIIASTLGDTYSSLSAEHKSWAAETLNMASGQVKQSFKRAGFEIDRGIPELAAAAQGRKLISHKRVATLCLDGSPIILVAKYIVST